MQEQPLAQPSRSTQSNEQGGHKPAPSLPFLPILIQYFTKGLLFPDSFHYNTKIFDGVLLFSQSSQTLLPETRNRTFKVFHKPGVRHKPVIPALWREGSISNSTLTWALQREAVLKQNKTTTNTTKKVSHGLLANTQTRNTGFATRLPECKFIINHYPYFLLSL